MAWYDEAVFYHMYPLGLAGAPKTNPYGEPEHRLNALRPWISHIREIGCNALYIGPLFESVGHGYETTDYKKLDGRLGTNEDLTAFVKECHGQGIRVILDGVFNHTGRDFFAFQDIQRNREQSPYKDWYCRVNFWGNNEYNDGFSYDNWGGYNLMAKLNQGNPAVRDYICDVIRFWAREFEIDGIRLDAADVLDFDYMHALRRAAGEIGPDFWLMGEVIHGDYTRWVNEGTLHSVTNYSLHKALYSGHNEHNYFEIAHTVKRLYGMGGNRPDGLKLYNFVDNHDVERIYTKLNNKAHFVPVHILLYTLPGVPSIYYGSEFGIEGKKERYSDDSIRPALNLADFEGALEQNECTRLIRTLGKVRQRVKALSYGDYQELMLTNRQYGFSRIYNGECAVTVVNNDDNEASVSLPVAAAGTYRNLLTGENADGAGGRIYVKVPANSGGIWVLSSADEDEEQDGACGCENGAVSAKAEPEKPEASKGQKAEGGSQDKRCKGKCQKAATGPDAGQEKEAAATLSAGRKKGAATAPSAGRKKETATAQDAGREKETAAAPSAGRKKGAATGPDAGQEKGAATALNAGRGKGAAAEKAAGSTQPEDRRPDMGERAVPSSKETAPSRPKTYEEMSIEELQQAILDRMAKNGPITDRMRQDVMENVYHNSLINWIKSFH